MGKVRLIAGLDVTAKKIEVLLERGRQIQGLSRIMVDEVEEFQESFFSWNEYTSTLLESSFDVKGAMQGFVKVGLTVRD
jgi:hypothetical protein